MKRKLPTILILLVMLLVGGMYWIDLSYYTDATGFVTRGPLWVRYAVLALPVLMCLLGLRTVGPCGIAVFRVPGKALGGVFAFAGIMGIVYGCTRIITAISPMMAFELVLGAFVVWYGAWMLLAARQIAGQKVPSPTNSAILGVLAAMPYCLITIQRVLVSPSSLYRVGPLIRSVAPMIALLWFVMLLRSLYVALPRRRVRWLYFLGVCTFLFSTCLELPLAVYNGIFNGESGMSVFESVFMAAFGIVAGCVSVALAGQSGAVSKADEEYAREQEQAQEQAQEQMSSAEVSSLGE